MSTKTRKLQIWWMDDEPDRLKNFPKDAIQKPSHAPKRQAELTMVDLKVHNSIGAVLKLLEEAKKKKRLLAGEIQWAMQKMFRQYAAIADLLLPTELIPKEKPIAIKEEAKTKAQPQLNFGE